MSLCPLGHNNATVSSAHIINISKRWDYIVLGYLVYVSIQYKASEEYKARGKLEEEEKSESSSTVLTGLGTAAYSQVLSHYCLTRELLPAVFPPWAGSLLFNQPGELRLLRVPHIDAKLSADTRST